MPVVRKALLLELLCLAACAANPAPSPAPAPTADQTKLVPMTGAEVQALCQMLAASDAISALKAQQNCTDLENRYKAAAPQK